MENVLQKLDEANVQYWLESGRAKICCPFHHEKEPSFFIFEDNSCYCFGCQKFCWHDELIAKIYGCTVVEAKKMLGTYDPNAEYTKKDGTTLDRYDFADEPKDFTSSYGKLSDEIPPQMKEFLDRKHIYDIAIEGGGWKWCPKNTFNCWKNMEGICIPYFSASGFISTYRMRMYDKMRGKFGPELAARGSSLQPSYYVSDFAKPVYFAEGASDSMSLLSLGKNVICLPGVGAHKQLNSAISQCFDWGVPELIFCGDNDDAGRKFNDYAIRAVYDLGLGIYTPKMSILKLPDEYNTTPDGGFKRKDINDFLVEGRLKGIIGPPEKVIKKSGIDMVKEIMGTPVQISLDEGIF